MPAKKVDPAEKARAHTMSLKPAAIADLDAIKAATGENHGAIVTRLASAERKRIDRKAAKS